MSNMMRKEGFIRYLAITTVVVLAGIITLQIYWLVTSYSQQKSRFKTDIQNALSAANVKTTLKKAMASKNELGDAIDLKGLANMLERSEGIQKRDKIFTMPIANSSVKIIDTLKLLQYLNKILTVSKGQPKKLVSIHVEVKNEDLKSYKAAYEKELWAREIYLPFELAMISNGNTIEWSSGDSTVFRNIPFKSAIEEFSQVKSDKVYGLQAAFPDGNWYLLRKMILILSVSVILILMGSYSLGHLLIFFFTQKKLSDLRNDFMNNMTHELKTPISSVSVALEMVLDKSKNLSAEKKETYLVIAQKELKRLNLLTENILKILSLEKAEISIVKEEINVRAGLQSILDRLNPLLEEKGAALNLEVIPETMRMFADKVHLTNVMYNIIENAIKYNDKEKVEIKIKATQQEDKLVLQISDNGNGIPPQYLSSVFDKFFRVPKGNRHDVKGYGLGLSYVKGIVEKHGGTIEVSSELHTGSVFTIYLPLN
jgi:two-component system phosphate regulon sensor histidine kinase PhoR